MQEDYCLRKNGVHAFWFIYMTVAFNQSLVSVHVLPSKGCAHNCFIFSQCILVRWYLSNVFGMREPHKNDNI